MLAFGFAAAAAVLVAFAAPDIRLRRAAGWGAVGIGVAFGAFLAFIVTPELSKHLSFKGLFDRYRAIASQGEPLASYRVTGHGVAYYARGELMDLRTIAALGEYLREPATAGCRYALAPNDELAPIDQQLRTSGIAYHVADASSSRFLLLSNCLKGGPDQNPLRTYVRQAPPAPGRAVAADFEGKIDLIGVDLPAQVSRARDGKFKVTLHFRVKDKVPAGYRIFMHFDGAGTRINGDHVPLAGRFPTQYWSPGDFVSDPHEIEIPLMTTQPGVYTLFMGFYLGDKRLKVLSGPNDGGDRVNVGAIRIN
jgi:hypothetical protein